MPLPPKISHLTRLFRTTKGTAGPQDRPQASAAWIDERAETRRGAKYLRSHLPPLSKSYATTSVGAGEAIQTQRIVANADAPCADLSRNDAQLYSPLFNRCRTTDCPQAPKPISFPPSDSAIYQELVNWRLSDSDYSKQIA